MHAVTNPITIEQVKQDIASGKSTKIYYSAGTLWWTHLDEDLIQATQIGKVNRENFHKEMINDPNVPQEKKNEAQALWDLMTSSPAQTPMDPSGCPLYEATKPLDWIDAAVNAPDHFGKHKLDAFIKTHHQNCDRLIYRSWKAVNEKMDKDAAKS